MRAKRWGTLHAAKTLNWAGATPLCGKIAARSRALERGAQLRRSRWQVVRHRDEHLRGNREESQQAQPGFHRRRRRGRRVAWRTSRRRQRSFDRHRNWRGGGHCGSRGDGEERHIPACRDASEVPPATTRDGQRKELILKSQSKSKTQIGFVAQCGSQASAG
jgi:hypothetical protein